MGIQDVTRSPPLVGAAGAQKKGSAEPLSPAATARPTEDRFSSVPAPPSPRPEPFPAAIPGYSHPIDAKELPDPDGGLGVLSLNLANGAGDRYRTPANRAAQAALLREAGASVVGFQEVDTGVGRSGDVATAVDVVRHLNPAFEIFAAPGSPPVVDLHDASPATAIRRGADGTTLYQTPSGTLISGASFSGDDRGGGVAGDRGADATYGNALYVAAPHRVVDAYTIAVPHSAASDAPPVAGHEQLAQLADGNLTREERTALGDTNDAIRRGARTEPRTALIARVTGPDGKERTIINVHLAAGREHEALRQKQLSFLADVISAEQRGPPAREIVLMGDFNDSVSDVGRVLEPIGMRREVGGRTEGIRNIDQIWVSRATEADTSAQVKTNGVSDHPHAAHTVVR